MAINVSQPFHRTSAGPIDDSLNYSKAQMLAVNDNLMPSKWFTVCADDGQFYLYDKSNEPDEETGKFRLYQSGKTYSGGDGIDVDNENDEISVDEMPAEDIGEIVTPLPSIKKPYEVYSTKEQRIGFWVDGKPLYKKTFVYAGPITWSSTQHDVVIANISSLNIDNIISAPVGSCIMGSSWGYLPWTLIRENIQTSLDVHYYNNEKELHCRGYRSNGSASITNIQVTIQYTKTTDTPEPMYISIPVD